MIRSLLYACVVVLALAIGWHGWTLHRAWHYLEVESADQALGAPADQAKVRIVAFMNYASRPSKDINTTIMTIVEGEKDTRIVFHIVQPSSAIASVNARIVFAAARQHKFIEMHDELMRNEKPLIDENIRELATRLKLDPDKLIKDMDSPEVAAKIDREAKASQQIGIKMSPLFVFNHHWIYGPNSIEAVPGDFITMIRSIRNK